MDKKYTDAYMYPNPGTPNEAIIFDPEICTGCNKCVDYCRVDCLQPNPVPGKPPILLYPDECWYGGCCAGACPHPGAIRMDIPLPNRGALVWKRKDTGELFRVGQKEHPEPNTKPACG